MRTLDPSEATAAMLLVGIAATHALLGELGRWPQGAALQAALQPPPVPAAGSSARKAFDWCTDNVTIIHDVYWASACMVVADEQRRRRAACGEALAVSGAAADPACVAALAPLDDSPDCTLPDLRALPLNTARAKAEQQCLEEAITARK